MRVLVMKGRTPPGCQKVQIGFHFKSPFLPAFLAFTVLSRPGHFASEVCELPLCFSICCFYELVQPREYRVPLNAPRPKYASAGEGGVKRSSYL